MKYTTTIRIDYDVYRKAMPIIQNKLKSSLSKEVQKYLELLIKTNKK